MTLDTAAARLGIPAKWLRAIIDFESRGNPAAVNPRSGATGLIQFLPSTAAGLGTTTTDLARMSYEEQMEYVYRYFAPYASRIRGSLAAAYMAVLYPPAIGLAPGDVLWSDPAIEYVQNRELDRGGKGYITKADAAAPVLARAGIAADESGSPGLPVDTTVKVVAGVVAFLLVDLVFGVFE